MMMKNNVIKNILFPTCIVLATIGSFVVFSSTAKQQSGSNSVSVQSTNITTSEISRVTHEIRLKGYGEIVPMEVTQLSTRVNGTVVEWAEKFVRGGLVEKGEVLFKLEDSRYQAELKNAEADLLSAKADLEEELGRSKVAKSELERINSNDKNSLFLREPQINSAYGAVLSAEARLILAKNNLESTVTRAPFDALVVERTIGLGQFINAGNSVAVLYNVQTAEIEMPIAKFDSQFLPLNFKDQQAKVSLPDSNLSATGTLSRQLKLTDNLTRSNTVIVTIKDLYQQNQGAVSLQFGDYVEVEFAGRVLEDIYMIPEYLVNNSQVWIMNDKNVLQRRDVSLVRNENGYAIINGGFEAADKLVTSVPENPHQGMAVTEVALNAAQQHKDTL